MAERSTDMAWVNMASFVLINQLIRTLRDSGVLSAAQINQIFDRAIAEAENPGTLKPSVELIEILKALRP